VLKAIAESGMGRNATIKGGVVMRSISKNARRATQDLYLDFIRFKLVGGLQKGNPTEEEIKRAVDFYKNLL